MNNKFFSVLIAPFCLFSACKIEYSRTTSHTSNKKVQEVSFNQSNFQPNFIPNDTHFTNQHHLEEKQGINILPAWQFTKGEGVIVAVIDTGVLFGTDFNTKNFVPGYDYIEDRHIIDSEESEDDDGHGTLIAAIINQATDNGFGTAGIAPNAKIMPLRALDLRGNGEPEDIADAIKFAVDNNADIINLSLTKTQKSEVIFEAIRYAYKKGKVIIAAAGNDGINSAYYPAKYEEVIGFGSIQYSGELAPYTNFGSGVPLFASGGFIENSSTNQCGSLPFSVYNTIPTNDNDPLNQSFQGGVIQTVPRKIDGELTDTLAVCYGTSQASAMGTGVAALIVSILKNYGISNNEIVRTILIESSTEIENLEYSPGRLNAGRAVQMTYQIVNPGKIINSQIMPPDLFANALLERGRFLHKISLSRSQDYFLSANHIFSSLAKLNIQSSRVETLPSAEKDLNPLCWDATLTYGKEDNVSSIQQIMPACEKAVNSLASLASLSLYKRHPYYQALDSRGVARVFLGDFHGAIKDFKQFQKSNCSPRYKNLRSSWVLMLKKSENPFDDDLLDRLLKRDCSIES